MSPSRHRLAFQGPDALPGIRAKRLIQGGAMNKRARGEIRVHERVDGRCTYSLRFRVNGRRQSLTLGTDVDGWNERRVERKLEDILAAVRAGVWQPPAPPEHDDEQDISFHEFASRWWAARKAEGLRPRTQEDYEWQLRKHLLPFFSEYRVSDIDRSVVERYREEKLIERELVKAAAAAGHPMRDKRGQQRKPLEQREHQQNARHPLADPRDRRRAWAADQQPRHRQAAAAPDLETAPPLPGSGRAAGSVGSGRRDRPDITQVPDRATADDRRHGQVRPPRERDVPAQMAGRRRPPPAARHPRGEDRRRGPRRRPQPRRNGRADGLASEAAVELSG